MSATACQFCQAPSRGLTANHWTGERYERLDMCTACCFGADGHPKQRKNAPRKPQAKRAQPVAYGDWATMCMIANKDIGG